MSVRNDISAEGEKMRNLMKVSFLAVVLLLFSTSWLYALGANNEEIHWYNALKNRPMITFGTETYCSFINDKNADEFKELVYEDVDRGFVYVLEADFVCSRHGVFSLKERDLFMVHAIMHRLKNVKMYEKYHVGMEGWDLIAERLVNQYLGTPGGL